jgi:hypothetical protein
MTVLFADEPLAGEGASTRGASVVDGSWPGGKATAPAATGGTQPGSLRTELGTSGRGARDHHLDLALAPSAGGCHQRVEALQPKVRRQQPRGRQVQRAFDQQVEECWELAAGPGDLDAVVGRVLGQAERSGAVAEERSVALAEVEPACVDSARCTTSSTVASRSALARDATRLRRSASDNLAAAE